MIYKNIKKTCELASENLEMRRTDFLHQIGDVYFTAQKKGKIYKVLALKIYITLRLH